MSTKFLNREARPKLLVGLRSMAYSCAAFFFLAPAAPELFLTGVFLFALNYFRFFIIPLPTTFFLDGDKLF